MKFRDAFRNWFKDFERQFEQFDEHFAELDEQIAEAEATAPVPGDNETVVTKTEEMRPDGTRVVTTVTRTRSKTVFTKRTA